MRHLWIVPLIAALSACATTPVEVSDAVAVPVQRMLAFAHAARGDTSILVTRDRGLMGHGCGVTVSIDKTPAVLIEAAEKAVLYVTPGDHILAASSSGQGLCAIGSGGMYRTLKFTATAGRQPQFRVGSLSSGDMSLTQTAL